MPGARRFMPDFYTERMGQKEMKQFRFRYRHKRILRSAWLGAVLLIAGCTPAETTQQAKTADTNPLQATDLERVAVGSEAPDFTLESSDGRTVTLSSFRNRKNVVLVFYRGYW
jgi:cytochrome oxidase Cu insertion factor (SCO1/SenC/PrrC family)